MFGWQALCALLLVFFSVLVAICAGLVCFAVRNAGVPFVFWWRFVQDLCASLFVLLVVFLCVPVAICAGFVCFAVRNAGVLLYSGGRPCVLRCSYCWCSFVFWWQFVQSLCALLFVLLVSLCVLRVRVFPPWFCSLYLLPRFALSFTGSHCWEAVGKGVCVFVCV